MASSISGIKIEVCIDSVESALAAVQGGADRLEICGNLALGGGTTPSAGLVRLVKQQCPEHVELMAMVRPRTGDFLYSSDELLVMLEDIRIFAEIGITGVVLGALNCDGTIDEMGIRMLVGYAQHYKMQVCFHRAFDMVTSQQAALSTLYKITGISRILTSGGEASAPAGLPSLISLCSSLQQSNEEVETPSTSETSPHLQATTSPHTEHQLEIMPGSGINKDTVGPVLRALLPLGCRSVHLSGGGFDDSAMVHRPEGMGMGVGGKGEWGIWRTSEETVSAVRAVVDKEWEEFKNSRVSE